MELGPGPPGKPRSAWASCRQLSPRGDKVVTTIDTPGQRASNYYVANFTDYRFLQVFFPTRGVLAWYSRATGILQPLPGADDPAYVQFGAVWSPDGEYLVFARARAQDPNPPGLAAGEVRQRSQRTADPLRPLPHPLQ